MKGAIKKVEEFCKACDYSVRKTPGFPEDEVQLQCIDLLKEEVEEFIKANGRYTDRGGNITEVADALGDILYSVIFAALSYGIPLDEVFKEIHRSNITKLWPDGKARKRQFGRLRKGPNYKPPRLREILLERLKKKEEI